MSAAKFLMTSLLTATLTSALPPTPLVGSDETTVLQPRALGMKMSDRFSISGLDYSTWAAKMVTEGKLAEPTINKTVTIRIAAGSFTLDNVKCGVLASGNDGFQRSKDAACNFILEAAGALTTFLAWQAEEELCPGADDDTCVQVLDAVFTAGGAFVNQGLDELCPQAFDEIFGLCPGGVGGTAEITLTRGDGEVFSGSMGAINFEDDTATCPANPITDTEICKVVTAG
ncbi:hypothetical protein PTT_14599 [Pyrenophora teres f. teres 0-1]|uniref:Uncharacterized protein n=2 Tax=Pyrenophora teres f. teres TaxID=97479 RepID=E3RYH7_PYRTT|nr:hypothetical protein PTT_14599 [Pyrenophora teres f. teres 0-1]KAE8842815.1 hypothetical protein HRS9139_02112 [Pyrenophora teres f. teres]KAI1669677.1 hypothetical protein L13192_07136 [Pyrenophora tritici-repentis]CAA9960691.1 hypothetical protein PTMSG1_04075 [Pyrenophora teres f. maculata]KAE8870513.1 hypothetical protein PTNB29_00857 [Pyrenophora teres f. teres]